MKNIIFILLFFASLCCFSCNSEQPIDNTNNTFQAPKTLYKLEIFRPFSFQFTGKIGHRTIELFLSYQVLDWTNGCVNLQGDYNYLQQQKSSNPLEGMLCLEDKKISLHSPKSEANIESFKGQIEGYLQVIKGQYLTNSNQPNGVFELYNTSKAIAPKTLLLFAQKLQKQLQKNKDFKLDEVSVDSQGIFIKNFQTERVVIKNFGSDNFKWTQSLSSNKKTIDKSEVIDLWFYNEDADFVIVINNFLWESETNKDGTSKDTETISYEVWKPNGNELENIFLDSVNKTNLSKINWYAITKNGRLQLHQNKPEGLWEWN